MVKLVEKHIVTRQHSDFQEIDIISKNSAKLYNVALYLIQTTFRETNKYLGYRKVQKILQDTNAFYYRSLPAKVAQQTLRLLHKNYVSYFATLKLYKQGKLEICPSPPGFKKSVGGRNIITYTTQALSKPLLQKGVISPSKTDIRVRTKQSPKSIQQVRIVPLSSLAYKVEVVYSIQEKHQTLDPDKYASIDLGVNNLATLAFNFRSALIISGKPLKSINHFWNKTIAKEKKRLSKQGLKTSNYVKELNLKRNNKVENYLHNASRAIVNLLLKEQVSTLVIGYNLGWKINVNNGKKNNQNFVEIPFLTFVRQLQYKCLLIGIKVVLVNEAYTSKCSFLDNELVGYHNSYSGKRISRGMFRTADRKRVNADVNGALNILVKAFPDIKFQNLMNGIQGLVFGKRSLVVNPLRLIPYKTAENIL